MYVSLVQSCVITESLSIEVTILMLWMDRWSNLVPSDVRKAAMYPSCSDKHVSAGDKHTHSPICPTFSLFTRRRLIFPWLGRLGKSFDDDDDDDDDGNYTVWDIYHINQFPLLWISCVWRAVGSNSSVVVISVNNVAQLGSRQTASCSPTHTALLLLLPPAYSYSTAQVLQQSTI